MGAAFYCDYCGLGMDSPTIEEDLIHGGQCCPHCDKNQGTRYSTEEWLVELSQRIDEIEEKLKEI